MDDSDFNSEREFDNVKKFIGDSQVMVAHTVSGTALYFDLGHRLLETGKTPLGVYLGQRPESKGGGYGPIEPHMFEGSNKLLVIDGSLKQGYYLHVLRTLIGVGALRHPNVGYIIGSPEGYEMIPPVDLLLRAYERDSRLKSEITGKAASTFAGSHREEVLTAFAKKPRRIVGNRGVREYGISLALAVNGLDRDLYIEDVGDTSFHDDFIVERDDSGNMRLRNKEKRRSLLIISGSGRRARKAETILSENYTVRSIRADPTFDDGIEMITSGEYVPDVVFADSHLRGSDGSNGSSIARRTSGVPVFLMRSGEADTSFLTKAMGDGVRGVIDRDSLSLEKVEECLRQIFS